MFGGVDFAIHTPRISCARGMRTLYIGWKRKWPNPARKPEARRQHKADAGCAPVKIDGRCGRNRPTVRGLGGRIRVDVRISGEHRREAIFHHDGDLQIRPGLLQQGDGGRGQNAIAQRPQTDDRHPCAGGQAV